jgi:D-3-phosphoglycerate dehydrogenase
MTMSLLKKKLVITTSSFNDDIINKYKLKFKTIEINNFSRKLTEEETILLCKDAEIIIAGTEKYSKTVLEKLKKLKIIFRLGSGTDNIDTSFAKIKKIKILKNSINPSSSVSEFILTLILSHLKKLFSSNENLNKGLWKKEKTFMLQEKIVGLVGLGQVGKKLAKLLKNFNVNTIYYDKNSKIKLNGLNRVSINKLFKISDILVLCLPLNETSKNLIDFKLLKLLKNDSAIINTSRGGIVNEKDLIKRLKSHQFFTYYTDVFTKEPYKEKHLNLTNVIKTPHIAGSANLIRRQMEQEALDKCSKII